MISGTGLLAVTLTFGEVFVIGTGLLAVTFTFEEVYVITTKSKQ